MYHKIFRSNCLVAVVATLLCSALIVTVLYRYFEERVTGELADITAYLAADVEEEGVSCLERAQVGNKRITLIAPDGQVLYDSQAVPEEMDNHLEREEVQQALASGVGIGKRYSATLMEKTLYYAVRLQDGSVLRLAVSDFTIFALLRSILGPVALCGVLALGLASVLAVWLSRGIVRPLNELDLDQPEASGIYEELTPMLAKILRQKETIAEQLQHAKQQQEEFRLITENMREGFLVIDEDANLLTYNGSALRLLGVASAPEFGNVLQLNHSADFCSLVGELLRGGHGGCNIVCGGRTCQVMANPVLEQERVIGGVIVILDVTEETEREKLRREFTANVSHELKTPLTSISGFAELMRDGSVAAGDVMDFSSTIYDEAQRLITLVNDILKLSALDEGTGLGEWEEVDLYQLTQEIIRRLLPVAAKRGIRLELTGGSALLRGNRQILDEMVYNLCDNAIKYNKDKGLVEVSVAAGQKICLTVRDTGIGIAPEHQSRVFERFYRVDKSHSKEIGGTGLGLSIVKHGAMVHGAEVSLQSAVGQGTTVMLQFPALNS